MTDARYESAQLTNDGAGRGWDFTPTTRREPSVNGAALKGLLGVAIFVGVVWAVLARLPG